MGGRDGYRLRPAVAGLTGGPRIRNLIPLRLPARTGDILFLALVGMPDPTSGYAHSNLQTPYQVPRRIQEVRGSGYHVILESPVWSHVQIRPAGAGRSLAPGWIAQDSFAAAEKNIPFVGQTVAAEQVPCLGHVTWYREWRSHLVLQAALMWLQGANPLSGRSGGR